MKKQNSKLLCMHTVAAAVILAHCSPNIEDTAPGPKPGDIYREYSRTMGQTNSNWRVTDPNCEVERARRHLPNARLAITIDDLKGAVRAEALIDRWGGHSGTSNKKLRFNGFEWIDLPELETTPPDTDPELYVYQDNPIVEIPLEHLVQGENFFEGTCDDPELWWPQWGWDGILIRIYYEKSKSHPRAEVAAPRSGSTIRDNAVIEVKAESGSGIERVDVLAYYEGFDENGDGVYTDWHRHYWCMRNDSLFDIRGHAGSAFSNPYRVIWDTGWVPDQRPGAVKFLARVKDRAGMWYVTEAVRSITLERPGHSVQMYRASDIPVKFSIRNKQKKSCTIRIPDDHDLSAARGAILHLRTWNGTPEMHQPFMINEWSHELEGNNHNFDYDAISVPPEVLRNGDNTVSFYSETVHHGVEVLWPGPVLTVRYQR